MRVASPCNDRMITAQPATEISPPTISNPESFLLLIPETLNAGVNCAHAVGVNLTPLLSGSYLVLVVAPTHILCW
jgi:hypothetical protein